MKKRMICLFLALALLLPAVCAAREEGPAAQTLMTVSGKSADTDMARDMAQTLYSNGYTETETDYLMAVQYLRISLVYEAVFARMGFDQFTQEELAAFGTEADAQWEDYLNSYVEYNLTSENPTEDELLTLREDAEQYYASWGITRDAFLEELKKSAAYDRLDEYVRANYDTEATDEDVQAVLEEEVELEKQYFENDVYSYEIYKNYYGYDLYYIPAGYRGVLQILLPVDAELMDEYNAAQSASEEEGVDEEAATARIQSARQAIMDSKQDQIDEIYARLEAGESFIELIPDYNIDPGMQNEKYLAEGYVVHRESIAFDTPFRDAAFDENMQQVGDVSAPSLGMYGIYIVYYLRDVPEGMIELTAEERESIREALSSNKLGQLYNNQLLPQWEAECEIEYFEEGLNELGLTLKDGVPALMEEDEAPAETETTQQP